MIKDLAPSYSDIQLADSAGFPRLIDNEKIIHQSMKAKSASLLMSQERKPSRSRRLVIPNPRPEFQNKFSSHVNVKSR